MHVHFGHTNGPDGLRTACVDPERNLTLFGQADNCTRSI